MGISGLNKGLSDAGGSMYSLKQKGHKVYG
jgi:hypothetical protein